ncbi:DNA ligase 1-like isoform X2 [Temnothorax curvispinosus]|uniref:DNA ligase 1-like isoform X2 n=1 Tax=Temnothorax curvispinosus TaxID=300111 RepID=A0A6J1R181_9HYME|nr:DNA ligase 1-like isoform X2 [Temnothorax curvispinosus]
MEGSKEILTMSAMNPILYRVETYILPEAENLEVINQIQNREIAKQFNTNKSENTSGNNTECEKDALLASYNKREEFARFSAENGKLIGLIKIVKGTTNETETPLDERYDDDIVKHYKNDRSCCSKEHLSVQKTEYQSSVGPEESLYPVRYFRRINSLISIDERSENSLDTKKIEVLKDRETMLREREMNLQKRERELFRKEKKLRIAERILNDKMRQVDELLKLQINPLVDRRLEEAARILSDIEKSGDNLSEYKIPKKDVTRKEDISKKEEIPEKEDISKKEEIPRKDVTRNEYISKKEEIPKKEDISKKGEIPRKDVTKKEDILKREEVARKEEVPRKVEIPRRVEIPKNPQVNPIFDQRHRREESNKKTIHPMRSNSSSRKSSVSRTHSYASVRYRERPRMNYDDLNSTLSAASQDSPKLRTSQWFDPALYQKPHVFQRSASERHPRHKDTTGNTMGKLQKVVEERLDPVIEEEKIFRKVSDNICALQKNEAGFQNYGLVDRIPSIPSSKTERSCDNENRLSSYLDLEIGSKRHSRQNLSSASKDRPVSWTSETNEELQKKRQAYDSMTKQSAETKQSTENKENVACHTTNKIQKKKSKKFFLFR